MVLWVMQKLEHLINNMKNYFKNGIRIFQQGGKKYGNINVQYKDNKYNRENPYDWENGDNMKYYYTTGDGYNYEVQTYQDRGGGLGFHVSGGTNIPSEIKDFKWYNGDFGEPQVYGTPNNWINYDELYQKQYGNDWSKYREFEKQQNVERDKLIQKYFPNLHIK